MMKKFTKDIYVFKQNEYVSVVFASRNFGARFAENCSTVFINLAYFSAIFFGTVAGHYFTVTDEQNIQLSVSIFRQIPQKIVSLKNFIVKNFEELSE